MALDSELPKPEQLAIDFDFEVLPKYQVHYKMAYKAKSKKHRMHLRACAASFEYFYRYVGYEPADFHLEWADMFIKNLDTVILAPRNHGKSVWVSLMIIWLMIFPERWRDHFELEHQYLHIAYTTSTETVGKKWARIFHLEMENALRKLDIKDQLHYVLKNTEAVELSNLSRLQIMSVMGSIRSARAHFMFEDDLMKDKGQTTQEVINIYEAAIYPIRYANTHNMILGTVKAEDDILMTYLEKTEIFAGKLYKSINVDKNGNQYALWPSKTINGKFHLNKPLKWLHRTKQSITPVTFSREYQNEPVSDDFALMPLALLQSCNDRELSLKETEGGATYISFDLARSHLKTADYTVGVVFEVMRNYKDRELPVIIIRDIWVFHASQLPQKMNETLGIMEREPFYRPIIKKIKNWTETYSPQKVFIENNQFQETIVQMVKDPDLVGATRIPAVGVTTKGTEKHSQQKGIPVIRSLLMSKRLIFPYADPYSIEKMETLQDELGKWIEDPADSKFKCISKHDDQSMALWIGLNGILDRIDNFVGASTVRNMMDLRREGRKEKDLGVDEDQPELKDNEIRITPPKKTIKGGRRKYSKYA